jgi:hypothetical protein
MQCKLLVKSKTILSIFLMQKLLLKLLFVKELFCEILVVCWMLPDTRLKLQLLANIATEVMLCAVGYSNCLFSWLLTLLTAGDLLFGRPQVGSQVALCCTLLLCLLPHLPLCLLFSSLTPFIHALFDSSEYSTKISLLVFDHLTLWRWNSDSEIVFESDDSKPLLKHKKFSFSNSMVWYGMVWVWYNV